MSYQAFRLKSFALISFYGRLCHCFLIISNELEKIEFMQMSLGIVHASNIRRGGRLKMRTVRPASFIFKGFSDIIKTNYISFN